MAANRLKKSNDFLFDLVKSLNKAEKSHFKKYIAQNKDPEKSAYYRLFTAMNNLDEYDETRLKKKLNRVVAAGHFSALKNYLLQVLLKSLYSYNSGISIRSQVQELLMKAEILSGKGFHKESDKILSKAERISTGRYGHLLKLEGLYNQRWNITWSHDAGRIGKFMEEYPGKAEEYLETERLLIRCTVLAGKVAVYNLSKERYTREAQQIFEREAHELESKKLPFHAKYMLRVAWITHYLALRNFLSAYFHQKKLVTLIESNPDFIKDKLSSYISALHNLMHELVKLGRIDEFWRISARLKEIPKRYADYCDENSHNFIFMAGELELAVCAITGQFDKGLQTVKREEVEIRLKRIPPLHRTVWYFNLAILNFGAREYRAGLKWLSRFLGDASLKQVHTEPDLQHGARMLNLMIHAELKNMDMLEYATLSAKRYLSKRKMMQWESIILRYFQNLPAVISTSGQVQWFRDLKKELEPLLKNPSEAEMMRACLILPWIESRIAGKTMEEVMEKDNL